MSGRRAGGQNTTNSDHCDPSTSLNELNIQFPETTPFSELFPTVGDRPEITNLFRRVDLLLYRFEALAIIVVA
jgi:hypothetical protein